MTHREILESCMDRPGTFLTTPFGPDVLVVKVKSASSPARIFAQLFHLKGEPFATFNCRPVTGEFFRNEYPSAVSRGYHCPPVQQPHFITVRLDGSVPDAEILEMIGHSYQTVVAKLPKKYQKELDDGIFDKICGS